MIDKENKNIPHNMLMKGMPKNYKIPSVVTWGCNGVNYCVIVGSKLI